MFHLRHLIGEDGINCSYKTPTNGKNASFEVSRDLGALLRHSVSLPTKSYVLNIPSNAEFIDEENEAEKRLPNSTFNVERNLQIVAPPSIFATHAIARAIVSRFAPLLSSKENNEEAQQLQLDNQQDGNDEKKPNSQIVSINLHCLFSVLWQLSRRDPELCVQAMSSLLSMLQCLPPESLSNEPKSAIRDMHETLKRLRIEGSSAVSSLASACLSALSISSASPEFLFSTTAAFLCDNLTGTMSTSADLDLIQIPENHHRLGIYIQNRIFNGNETGIDWCSLPLTSLCVLSNFDMSTLPIEFSPTTPDEDRRLFSASASDGAYLYVLTYLGLFKMGTGLGETVIGKLYASNTMMRASRNCVLSLCQSSLYLRRGQSSRVWVLDTGTLREIGEIILPPESTQTAIFTDGDNFFQATVDQHSTLVITSLNDSFVPSTDPKAKQKYRLTEVSYSTFGDIEAIPNALPNTLPATLQNQAVDLHMGSDCAFLLARSGKVFYSGNGMRLGLQETGTTWMELVLPEPIVQLCVGSELVLFRSGGGHIWMAGGEERNRQQKHGKLRRIQTSNRRKTIGIAACGACFAYVTENGRVYAMGRHGMRTHPETGLVAGLEGVHLVSIALGKTHAAAVSRHGFLFTWGLNNLHQCGRVEASSTSTSPFSTPHQPMKSGGIKQKKQEQQEKDDPNAPLTSICPPNEHLFVKDVASVCIQCAQCSARGVSCNRSNAVKPGDLCPCGPGETACLRCGICRLCGDAEVGISNPENLHQDDTHGTSHKIILAPARVQLAKTGIDTKVAMVSCGNFHTIVLGADRSVYTFGSNCHGQLGVGDTKRHLGPCRIELPQSVQVVQVGAGSNHCVLRTSDGQVWTFGAHKQGQLGRDSSDPLWHCRPQAVPGFGPQSGILATWIGCVGDVTIVHSARSLFTHESIQDAQIIANKSCLFVFPREAGKDYVVIRRRQHTFAHHQLGPVGLYTSWCVDQEHSVIWSYSAAEMRVQGFIEAKGLSESEAQKENDDLCLLRNAEYFNPSETESKLSSTQMALSLLSSTYALSIMSLKPINHKEASNLSRIDSSTLLHEGYSVINRFEGHGGGWGYSAHSVEAIQFRVSRQIRLLGVGLFGGRGEYIAKIRIHRLIGSEADELMVEEVTETDETLYECGARQTAALMLSRPIVITAGQWHVVSAKISGPSSDCGASGRATIESDDVTFSFRNSILSNNGTDVNVGQIPELFYQVEKSDPNQVDELPKDHENRASIDFTALLRSKTFLTPTPEVFHSLLRIFDWAVTRAFEEHRDLQYEDQRWLSERAVAFGILSLRMIRFYLRMLYSTNSGNGEETSTEFAECVVKISTVFNTLFDLATKRINEPNPCLICLLDESVSVFVSIAHCLLPSKALTLSRLAACVGNPARDWALASTLLSLNNYKSILTLLSPATNESEPSSFPILAEKMNATPFGVRNLEKIHQITSFSNILKFFFDVAFGSTIPVMNLSMYKVPVLAQDLIVRIAKELVVPDVSGLMSPTLMQTPSRFRRRSAHPNWDLSSGAPDAICFRTDIIGVTLDGVGIYTGNSAEMTATVEVLLHQVSSQEMEWNRLEMTTIIIPPTEEGKENIICKFSKPVRLQPGTVYAIKVSTQGGTKTFGGEGGMNFVRLSNGARLVFNNCTLSENGTSLTRGQIPFLLYSLNDPQKQPTTTAKNDPEQLSRWFVALMRLLSTKISECLAIGDVSSAARNLIGKLSGLIMVFLQSNPQKALEVVSTIDQLLPMISSVNAASKVNSPVSPVLSSYSEEIRKTKQTIVESPHPYKPNFVQSITITLEKEITLMCLMFSEECQTAQADDVLTVYICVDRECYVPIGRFCGSRGWPNRPLLLPGNTLWFVLESGARVDGNTEEQMYGFRCTITGYPSIDEPSNLQIEQELAWISANVCRILVELPNDPEALSQILIEEEETRDLMEKHGQLLRKGLNVSHIPTAHELLSRSLPPPTLTSDLRFLREFISGSPATVAGLLARWLPLGPIVDLSGCQLVMGDEQLSVGSRNTIKFVVRDQLARVAQCSELSVEVTVQMGGANDSTRGESIRTLDNLPTLQMMVQNPFQPVYLNKARYMSICMMPVYSNYSNEELRLGFFRDAIAKETIVMTQKNAFSFCGEWIPRQQGTYRVECRVDGFQVPQCYTVEVVENGELSEGKRGKHRVAQLSRAQLASIQATAPFQAVRIRNSPSLSAQVIGFLPRGASLSFIEEVENGDGKWLRLTEETSALHAETHFPAQAWCLQFHKALDRELIKLENSAARSPREEFSRGESVEMQKSMERAGEQSVLIETQEMYVLEDGDRVDLYQKPALDSAIDGEFLEGRRELLTDGWIHNGQGVWIRLAHTKRFILAEDHIGGRSSVHSQVQSSNGNDDEETKECRPLQTRSSASSVKALRPSVVDCCRTVFAAFLWHEHLVKDAMAAAAYLKFHTHLHNLWPCSQSVPISMAPTPLQPLVKLWKEVCTSIQNSIHQHLILPSPPALRHSKGASSQFDTLQSEPGILCELCEERSRAQITVHMRMSHPGCGSACQGHGFNSNGKYTSGWAGLCGDGGRSNTTWYLMCPPCRARYLKQTPTGHQQERSRRWREFRLSSAQIDCRPETVIKQNALFLLELNASVEGADGSKSSSATNSGWTTVFPGQLTTITPSVHRSVNFGVSKHTLTTTSHQIRRDSDTVQPNTVAHSSDPGPKVNTSSRAESSMEERVQINAEVLQSPSAALVSLVSLSSACQSPGQSVMMRRPVMAFVIEHHDLKRVRESSIVAVRRAVGFSHAFRVWNWLLRLVSSETSVSDIVLQYLSSLSSYSPLVDPSQSSKAPVKLLAHPWRLCFLAGPIAVKMVQQLHSFLYTIAVILQSSGVDPGLRSLCFQAWTIQLTAHEQDLLSLTCSILASVGRVLSDPSNDRIWVDSQSQAGSEQQNSITQRVTSNAENNAEVKQMEDITQHCRIEASSRQAMVVCLTDASMETFWESGEEDKSRSRLLSINCESEVMSPVLLAIFFDNVRDEQFRTSFVQIRALLTDGSKRNLHSQALDAQFVGWMKACITGAAQVQIVLRGPFNAQRVRQLSISGFYSSPSLSPKKSLLRPSQSHQLLFSTTQSDAFSLFQALSAQAFSDEMAEEQHGTLRQRVIDLLFSRVQLQPLQTHVCTQIANALDREVIFLRDRSKKNYSYACGLMHILTRICASRRGTEVFSARNYLLITLSELLLFSPQVVQCQVIETIEKLLGVFSPAQVESGRFVGNLLVCVAKVICLQVRDKSAHTVNTATLVSSVTEPPSHWKVEKVMSAEMGRLIHRFILNACQGDFSEEWAAAFRRECAAAVVGVLRMGAHDFGSITSSAGVRSSASLSSLCPVISSRRFWLAVSALSVVKEKQWMELADGWTSVQGTRTHEPEPLCENHDDGRTLAQVFCEVCRCALCRDCFSILHLNKRNRNHEVRLLGSSTTTPQVEIHEGCSRLRLSNMLVLFHGSTLNGLVEVSAGDPLFPSSSFHSRPLHSSNLPLIPSTSHQKCRFCENQLIGDRQSYEGICAHNECIELGKIACRKTLTCEHRCGGIIDELSCLECLQCPRKGASQDGDDVCVICFTDRLGAAPCIKLTCGHIFHYLCVRTVLEKRWNGPRILFRFMNCPLCNIEIDHPGVKDLLDSLNFLKNDVIQKAKLRLEYDGLLGCPALVNENSEFFGQPESYAMERYVYVQCHKCGKAYFGGESRCQLPLDSSQYNPSELICGGCSDVSGAQICGRHGVEYLEYKCRFCCSIAVYFCFGTTHFCAPCHDDFQRLVSLPKHMLPKCPAAPRAAQMDEGPCPLRIDHPPTGEEFALGCGICRNLSTF